MPHHGSTTIGKTIEEAAVNTKVLERLAELHYNVMLLEEPTSLPPLLLNMFVEMAKKKKLLV
jgi:ribulose-5-phosphate 4-epimerase/fuculose-1-phosphate aldolase